MNHKIDQRFNLTLLAAFISAIGVSVPLLSYADDDSEDVHTLITPSSTVEIGVGHVSEDSFKFGDYGRGMQKSGPFLIGNIELNKRGENNANYFELIGRNLGLDSRNVQIQGGQQGNYGVRFEYDEFSKLHSDSFQSPYLGLGTTSLTAPAGWAGTIDTTPGGAINAPVAATVVTPAMMTALAANMKQFDVETKRKASSLGFSKQLNNSWEVALNYKREEKAGTKLLGAPLQLAGGGSRGTVLIPEAINYSTDLMDVIARYTGEQLQMQGSYHVSLFNNANSAQTFDNLFYNALSAAGGNMLTGRMSQMPDNQFHQMALTGGYTFSHATRLTGNLSIGRMKQNDTFLAYNTTANLLPATTSLDGKVDTTHADLKLHSKVTPVLNVSAGFKYDDKDNRTAINSYTYPTADNTAAPGASNTRKNTPLSKTQQVIYVDLDLAASTHTKLKLGYDYDKVTHTFEPTSGDHEQNIKAEVKHSFNESTVTGLAYVHSVREADTYNGAAPLMDTYTAAYLANTCVAPNTFVYNGVVTACTGTASATSTATMPFLDTPALRKFFLADRKRDKLHAYANLMPNDKLDLQFSANYYQEKYPDTYAGFGLTKATGWTANFDANLVASETVSGTFFTSVEDYSLLQNGHNGASSAAAPTITTLDRQNNTAAFDPLTGTVTRTDRSLTMGLGIKVQPSSTYEWGSNFTYAQSVGSTSFGDIGSRIASTVLPVPDTITRLKRFELFGKYNMKKNVTLNAKYMYEKYHSVDWAWDGQTLTSTSSMIGSEQISPNYEIHVIGVSATYGF